MNSAAWANGDGGGSGIVEVAISGKRRDIISSRRVTRREKEKW